MKRFVNWASLLTLGAATLCVSCSDDDVEVAEPQVSTARLCVVMPASQQRVWQRDVDWAVQNFRSAQSGLAKQIDLSIEWIDEEAADVADRLNHAAADTGVVAIVGPYSSTVAAVAGEACASTQKPLILPIVTSVELQRLYAGNDFVWNLTQSDITQCEILLTQAIISECSRVSLLTSDDVYGKSYSDWFAYQATELGLDVERVDVYHDDDELRSAINVHVGHSSEVEMLLFAPSTRQAAVVFDEEYGQIKAKSSLVDFPLLLCTDVVNADELKSKLTHSSYEGVAPCASPMSGFNSAYAVRYGEEPTSGEAHLYDAVSLVAYALTARVAGESLNDAILRVVDGREACYAGWLPADMRRSLVALQQGALPDLAGVSGDWTFDARNHASVLNTTYAHWILKDGAYTTVEYLSTDGAGRTTSTLQAWDVETSKYQQFTALQDPVDYGKLANRYAVVVGTSDTWGNYRHQADALAMYQLLKRHGYDDEHILLIIADNIAYDSHNLYPGVVRVRPDGENVYTDVNVDYHINDITPDDFAKIMMGQSSERLPKVLPSGSQDNVIVFWCGHGTYGHLAWGSYNSVTGKEVADIFRRMKAEQRFRKLLLAVDACYSGSIGEACDGIPGLLAVTAATPYEPSKADMKDVNMGIWLSNAFTRVFQETIDADPDISVRDLYYYLARATTGSHVTVYNTNSYGNIFTTSMAEYLGE